TGECLPQFFHHNLDRGMVNVRLPAHPHEFWLPSAVRATEAVQNQAFDSQPFMRGVVTPRGGGVPLLFPLLLVLRATSCGDQIGTPGIATGALGQIWHQQLSSRKLGEGLGSSDSPMIERRSRAPVSRESTAFAATGGVSVAEPSLRLAWALALAC